MERMAKDGGEMTFTDEELKRLKEEIASDFPRMGTPSYMLPLLRRLEAAEKLLPPEALEDCGEPRCTDCAVYRPWRKAAGK